MKLTYLLAVFASMLANVRITFGNDISYNSDQSVRGRKGLSLARAKNDLSQNSRLPANGFTENSLAEQSPPTGRDFIRALVEDNEDVWKQFVNHPFCLMMGSGSASLEGFKEYMIQDFVFLRSDIRFQFGLYYRTEDWSILSTEALQIITRGFEYAKEQLDTCIEDLQISKTTMLTAAPTHQLQKYIDFQHEALENESWISHLPHDLFKKTNAWLQGYYEIAHRLKYDPFTRNDTVFYQLWIEPNSYPDDLEAYTDYLNKNLAHVNPHPIEVERWSALFRKACEMEISFLDTGLLNQFK
ncbi:hypothetical protein FRC09_000144 [Ceratobasidium sp. 395]|nr:hypothetical protein FRC09_000144 [Ceratobasidium sp. 395]